MKILIVLAHPDDETIGMGGTLKKLTRHNEVLALFLSEGITSRKRAGYINSPSYEVTKEQIKKMSKEIEIRKKHTRHALDILGVKKIRFLDLPNNELDAVPLLKIVKEIEKEITSSKCGMIFTHHYNDLNIDHQIAYNATITAARPLFNSPVKSIVSFESISSTDWRKPYKFNPNMFVDISSELKHKLKALREYKHEIRKFPHPRSEKTVEATAIRWGSLYGVKAAEAFEIVMTRVNDFNKTSLFS